MMAWCGWRGSNPRLQALYSTNAEGMFVSRFCTAHGARNLLELERRRPVADMTRQGVTINLNPGCEIPAAREFARPHLIADVRRERGRHVAAELTIVQAWIVAGAPANRCPPLASYGN